METQEILQSIQHEIALIKKVILSPGTVNNVSEKWIPRSDVMRFFNYAPTQMASLEKSGDLVVTKVGKRKFILRESITRMLDKNIQDSSSHTAE